MVVGTASGVLEDLAIVCPLLIKILTLAAVVDPISKVLDDEATNDGKEPIFIVDC